MKDDDYMDLNEAVKHIMQATGKTRRQARAAVVQAMKNGRIRARGVVEDPETGERFTVPIEPCERLQ